MKTDNITTTDYGRKRAKELQDAEWVKFVAEMDKLKIPKDRRPTYKQFKEPFNPEGNGYDYVSAVEAGITPSAHGSRHWPSRIPSGPNEGLLLKGKTHKTWYRLKEGEEAAGNKIITKSGRSYGVPKQQASLKLRHKSKNFPSR